MSSQTAPSKGAKLCTYHHSFDWPSNLRSEPCYEPPMGISKLPGFGAVQTWVPYGAILPGQHSRATFAGAPFATHKLWAMNSIVCLICPRFSEIRVQIHGLFQDAAGCMRMFVHPAQEPGVCPPMSHCLAAKGSDMNIIRSS